MDVSTISAELFELYINKKADKLFKEFTVHEVNEFFQRAEDENFGEKGNYTFRCSKCGATYSFYVKRDMDFYKKFHNITGCPYEIKVYSKTKKNGKKVTGIIKKRVDNVPINQRFKQYLESLMGPSKTEEDTEDEQIETTVSEQQEAK